MESENEFFDPDSPGESLDDQDLWSDIEDESDLVHFIEQSLIPPTPTSGEDGNILGGENTTTAANNVINTTASKTRRKRKHIGKNVESGEGSFTARRGNYKKSNRSRGELTSKTYKGVRRYPKRFGAYIWDKSNPREKATVYLGGFDVEEDAARAYDLAALRFCGKSSKTNFPLETYEKDLEEMESLDRREYLLAIKRKIEKCNAYVNGSSAFRGVSRNSDSDRWQAKLGKGRDRKGIYLGVFDTEKEAARAYDVAAIKLLPPESATNYPRQQYNVEEIMNSNKFLIGEGASKLIQRYSVDDVLLIKRGRKKSVKDELLQTKQGSTSSKKELPVEQSPVQLSQSPTSLSGDQLVPPLHAGNEFVSLDPWINRGSAIVEDCLSKFNAFQEMRPFDPTVPNSDFQLQQNPNHEDIQIQSQYSNLAVPPPQMDSGLIPELGGAATLEVQPKDSFVSNFGLGDQNQNHLSNQSTIDANQYMQQQHQQQQEAEIMDMLGGSDLQHNNGMQVNSSSGQFNPSSGYAHLDMQQLKQKQQVPDSQFNSCSVQFDPSLGYASQDMQQRQQQLVPDQFGFEEDEAYQFLESFLNDNVESDDMGNNNYQGFSGTANTTWNLPFDQPDMARTGTTTHGDSGSFGPNGAGMGSGRFKLFRPNWAGMGFGWLDNFGPNDPDLGLV